MKRKLKSTRKGFERAKKLHDLEVAKSLEINDLLEKNIRQRDPKQSIPVTRSDLPKE